MRREAPKPIVIVLDAGFNVYMLASSLNKRKNVVFSGGRLFSQWRRPTATLRSSLSLSPSRSRSRMRCLLWSAVLWACRVQCLCVKLNLLKRSGEGRLSAATTAAASTSVKHSRYRGVNALFIHHRPMNSEQHAQHVQSSGTARIDIVFQGFFFWKEENKQKTTLFSNFKLIFFFRVLNVQVHNNK